MDWKNLHGYIEVSPFMLFESTGDSEEDSDLNNSSLDDGNIQVTNYDEVDDAQSCCSDPSEICNAHDNDQFQGYSYSKKTDRKRVHVSDYNNCNYRHHNEYDEDELDDDDGAVDQECSSRNVGFLFSRAPKKCKVYIDSEMEPVKKEEKDKLFWDTCLAS